MYPLSYPFAPHGVTDLEVCVVARNTNTEYLKEGA